jgi:uncharacterized protein YbaR (Trm112 family)
MYQGTDFSEFLSHGRGGGGGGKGGKMGGHGRLKAPQRLRGGWGGVGWGRGDRELSMGHLPLRQVGGGGGFDDAGGTSVRRLGGGEEGKMVGGGRGGRGVLRLKGGLMLQVGGRWGHGVLRLKGGLTLLTHNLLASPLPGLNESQRYPLAIEATEIEVKPLKPLEPLRPLGSHSRSEGEELGDDEGDREGGGAGVGEAASAEGGGGGGGVGGSGGGDDASRLSSMLPRLDWEVFLSAVRALGGESALSLSHPLPASLQDALRHCEEGDEDTVRGLQRALFETHVLQGYLVCPASGTKFPITNGIPNFISPTSIHLHNAHASVCSGLSLLFSFFTLFFLQTRTRSRYVLLLLLLTPCYCKTTNLLSFCFVKSRHLISLYNLLPLSPPSVTCKHVLMIFLDDSDK